MLQLSLRFPQLLFLWRFVKFVFGVDIGQLRIFLFVFVLKIFQDGVYVVALIQA